LGVFAVVSVDGEPTQCRNKSKGIKDIMIVKVLELNKERRVAKVQIGNDYAECRFIYPSNKGAENDAWVSISEIHSVLGDGTHKKWLTVPRVLTTPVEVETLKKPNLPLYIHINNIQYYCEPAEYEIVKQIFARATKKLDEARKEAGL
jgi:hypothetical protein